MVKKITFDKEQKRYLFKIDGKVRGWLKPGDGKGSILIKDHHRTWKWKLFFYAGVIVFLYLYVMALS